MRASAFAALVSAMFAAAFGYAAIMPLLPELLVALLPQASEIGISRHAGALAAAYMVALVVFSPVWGAAADRHGARAIILLGLAGSALALLAAAFAQGIWTAYAARAVQGAFAAAILPVATAALAEIADTAERARKVAGLGAAALLGYFAGPALSAVLMSVRTAQPAAIALIGSALLALFAFAIVAAFLGRAARREAEVQAGALRALPARFLALSLLAYFGLGAFEVALPLAARGPLAADPAGVSILFMECSLVMLAAQGVLMWAAPFRARFPQVLVAAIAVYGAGLLWLGGADSFAAAVPAIGLIAAGSGVVLPLIAFLATLEIRARPGAALGALTAAGGLGQALGSLSGGALYGYAGMGMFAATAFAVALGAWLASPACAPRWLGGANSCTKI